MFCKGKKTWKSKDGNETWHRMRMGNVFVGYACNKCGCDIYPPWNKK